MARAEAALPEGERIQAVVIVTPNHLHHPVARAFLERGIHIICDKPLAVTVEEADDLSRLTAATGLVFAVTYNYSGYPLVKEARARVREGGIGPVRKVVVEYSQGWLAELLEAEGHKQAEWRADALRGGPSAVLGDIGSHAHHLLRYVTGLEVRRLFADLGTVVEGRAGHDDAVVLLELEGGVRGVLMASQIATGERNHLRLRVYGSEGGLDWNQEQPNRLRLLRADGSEEVVYRAAGARSASAAAGTRLPGGHPEGFVGAFANLYREVARAVRARDVARARGGPPDDSEEAPAPDFPTVQDGARGIHFIDTAIRSDRAGSWMEISSTEDRRLPIS
jgi:predicted dehydrogenase